MTCQFNGPLDWGYSSFLCRYEKEWSQRFLTEAQFETLTVEWYKKHQHMVFVDERKFSLVEFEDYFTGMEHVLTSMSEAGGLLYSPGDCVNDVIMHNHYKVEAQRGHPSLLDSTQ